MTPLVKYRQTQIYENTLNIIIMEKTNNKQQSLDVVNLRCYLKYRLIVFGYRIHDTVVLKLH